MKTVFCRKYQKDLPKMDRAPFPGEKGEEIFSSVSKQAWMEWLQPVSYTHLRAHET